MYCVSHAALMEPGELPGVLRVSGQDGDGPSALEGGVWAWTACSFSGRVLRPCWLLLPLRVFCAMAVDEYRRAGVLPLVADAPPRAGDWIAPT